MKINHHIFTPALILILLGLNACSVNKQSSSKQPTTDKPARIINAIDLNAVKPLGSLAQKLAKHRVVFVGEQHTDYGDHLNQLAIIKSLHKTWGNKTSIGLEMIQQPYQSFLDNYISGKISQHKMLRGVEWYDRWKYDFRLYRPIFDYAKENNIPLVALNIPKELTKRITKVGIKGLNHKERSLLPQVLDKSNPAYRARLQSVFGMHSHTSSKGFEKFFEAQMAWDEGMAFGAAKYLKKNPAKHMVILAGGGHIINREGIPSRLDRQIHSTSAVVLNHAGDLPSSQQGDFLLFSADAKLPPAGLMGIFMIDTANGVKVKSLTSHGAAKKAGVAKGDTIIELNEMPVKAANDIKIWGLDKKPGDKVKLKLKRNNKIIYKTLTLKHRKIMGIHSFGKMFKK